MDRASSLIFPGSKTIAGWWRQLAPYQPQAYWIGYGFVHRVEASVKVLCKNPVEPFAHLVLQALALEQTLSDNHGTGAALSNLQTRLRMPAAVIVRVLVGMQDAGWLARIGQDHWQITEPGRRALSEGQYEVPAQERRVFPFLERMNATAERIEPGHFLPVAECVHVPWQVDDAHRFEPRWLHGAIEQSADWKQSYHFPPEIQTFLTGTPGDDGRHVLLVRPERVLLVSILAGAGEREELLCFAVKVDGWTLFDRTPVVRLPASARAPWPELESDPTSTIWQEAWSSWCRQRQMPANEVEICSLTYRAPRLEVQAPPRLVQRLQAAKSDLFKGEAWLLVGEGYSRTAAQLVVRV